MSKVKTVPEKIFQDLEEIYHLAIEKGHLAVALKVKELLGREQGLFIPKASSKKSGKISLSQLSDEDLSGLMKEIEAQLALDPPP